MEEQQYKQADKQADNHKDNQKENVKENVKENKMGVMAENRLLLSMSIPMMVSMLVQALYNVVDSIFVSRINENALTAVSLAFPIQSLMIGLGVGTGVGVNALLSRSLGERDYKKVNDSAEHGIFLSVLSYFLFLVIGLTMVVPFYRTQTNDPQILQYGVQYLSIVCCCSFGMFAQFIFERLLQATGKTVYTMITQTVGAVINIILDPILIFGLFGAPRLEVAGAAIATVIGQIAAGILAMVLNHKKNEEVHMKLREFRPKSHIIGQIYAVGFPSIIMQSIGSLMVYGMNMILIQFSSTATAVFGVYFKLQSFVFMPVFGLNNGMVPIIAYNYGAGHKKRLVKTIKLSVFYAVLIMGIGLFIFQVFPDKLFMLFDASEYMLQMGIPALRILSLPFCVAGFCIIGGSVFQALGNGTYSMLVAICRQMVVLLPAAYLLSRLGEVNYVWWSFPIAEVASFAVTVFFMFRINRRIISKI